jgi:hypothetical protein
MLCFFISLEERPIAVINFFLLSPFLNFSVLASNSLNKKSSSATTASSKNPLSSSIPRFVKKTYRLFFDFPSSVLEYLEFLSI